MGRYDDNENGYLENMLRGMDLGWLVSISEGSIPGVASNEKFGMNNGVGTAYETMWWGDGTGGDYAWPASGQTMYLSSSDADDTVAGAGAQTVEVDYLDSNYAEQSVTLDMAGVLASAAILDVFRIQRMRVVTDGATGPNLGHIYLGTGTITAGKPANIFGSIGFDATAGFGQSLQAFWTVPLGKTAFITDIEGGVDVAKGVDCMLQTRAFGEAWNTRSTRDLYQTGYHRKFVAPLKILEKADLRMMTKIGSSGGSISGAIGIIIEDNVVDG